MANIEYYATGRRKTSTARVFLRPGTGAITVNHREFDNYFPTETLRMNVRRPLTLTENLDKFDVLATVDGGGVNSQSGAVRLGIARALVEFNAELRKMIADRTYHRLLHVDWIAADVDGDGRVELISRTDQVGATPPARAYDLFAATPKTEPKSDTERRFYMGGSIYENWAAVPESYKNSNSNRPDPARSTASIFSFRF